MHRTREFRTKFPEIKRILMEQWDPIGVRDEPMCADEYDVYATHLFGLLARGASDNEIVGYFGEAEDRIGLGRSSRRGLAPIVTSLRAIGVQGQQPEADV
ncbi:MAG: hypothetical protein WBQ26_03700 [Gemmatimonadaceae bacterium]